MGKACGTHQTIHKTQNLVIIYIYIYINTQRERETLQNTHSIWNKKSRMKRGKFLSGEQSVTQVFIVILRTLDDWEWLGHEVDGGGIAVRFLAQRANSSCPKNAPTGSGTYTASYGMGPGNFLPRGQAVVAWSWPPPSCAQVKCLEPCLHSPICSPTVHRNFWY